MSNVPDDLLYTPEHEYVAHTTDAAIVRVGITDYAQDALGDVVFVETPTIGESVAAGDTFGEVESTKSVSDLYAPVAGTVVEVNDALADAPQSLNDDPYGDGWLVKVRLSDVSEVDELLEREAYESTLT